MSWFNRIRIDKEKKKEERRQTFVERQQKKFNFEGVGIGKAGIGFLDALVGIDQRTDINQVFPLALAGSRTDYEFAQYLHLDKNVYPLLYSGAGGDQRHGQRIAMRNVDEIVRKIKEDAGYYGEKNPPKAIVLFGSLGGGTGGGAIPFLAKALKLRFPKLLMIVVGILPEIEEGNVFFVNASRSFRMMWNLMIKEPQYIDTLFLFENPEGRRGGQINSLLEINNEFATAFNLMFGSSDDPYTLDPQDRIMILRKGKTGISLMRYWSDTSSILTMRSDSDIEQSKTDCSLMMRENLDRYPLSTLKNVQFAAFQIRCKDKYIPRDIINILTKLMEDRLAGIEPKEEIEKSEKELDVEEKKAPFVPIVKGGAWAVEKSRLIELGTMIVGIDPRTYEYLDKYWDMYKVLYGDTFRKDLNEIWNWRL